MIKMSIARNGFIASPRPLVQRSQRKSPSHVWYPCLKGMSASPQEEAPDKPRLRDMMPGAWLGVLHKSQRHERRGGTIAE